MLKVKGTPEKLKAKKKTRTTRGKRMSQLVSTSRLATPHPKIHPREYYTLIDNELPEPLKMKQLLLWCTQASKPSKPTDLDPLGNQVDLSHGDPTRLDQGFT